jgi:membrane-associated protein
MSPVDVIRTVTDYILHLDRHVAELVENYGGWALLILFLIIFCETGLVVTPFLPGDSLLFAAGAIAATGALNVGTLIVLLIIAAILGDSTNYWIGSRIGTRAFKENARVMKTEYLRRTQDFFTRYGGKTIVIARFVPIVRTYAPFVAGVAGMSYQKFLTFNVLGGIAWILIFVVGGYLFGAIPVVEDNFGLVIVAVILLSLVPILFEYSRTRRARRISARMQEVEEERSAD